MGCSNSSSIKTSKLGDILENNKNNTHKIKKHDKITDDDILNFKFDEENNHDNSINIGNNEINTKNNRKNREYNYDNRYLLSSAFYFKDSLIKIWDYGEINKWLDDSKIKRTKNTNNNKNGKNSSSNYNSLSTTTQSHYDFVSIIAKLKNFENKRLVLTASGDKTIKVWKIKNDTNISNEKLIEISTLVGHEGYVDQILELQRISTYVLSKSFTDKIILWETKNFSKLAELENSSMCLNMIELENCESGNKEYNYVAASQFNNVVIWDYLIGNVIFKIESDVIIIKLIKLKETYFPDNDKYKISVDRIITAGKNSKLKLWSININNNKTEKIQYKLDSTVSAHIAKINTLDLLFNNQFINNTIKLATGSEDGSIKIWDIEKKENVVSLNKSASSILRLLDEENNPVKALKNYNHIDSNQLFVIAGYESGVLRIWNIDKSSILKEFNFNTTRNRTAVNNILIIERAKTKRSNFNSDLLVCSYKTSRDIVIIRIFDDEVIILKEHKGEIRCLCSI